MKYLQDFARKIKILFEEIYKCIIKVEKIIYMSRK